MKYNLPKFLDALDGGVDEELKSGVSGSCCDDGVGGGCGCLLKFSDDGRDDTGVLLIGCVLLIFFKFFFSFLLFQYMNMRDVSIISIFAIFVS